jgi:hypothetical protein
MLHDTRITEKHSTAAILSNEPRWGMSAELSWRRKHAGQHVRSAWKLPKSAPSRSASASSSDRQARRAQTTPSDYFSRLSGAGAYKLTGEELKQRQKAQIFSVVRKALEQKRSLFGSTLNDTLSLFNAMDTDNSGSLDRFEFRRAMRRLGVGLSTEQIEQLVQAVDSDRSGDITYAEFLEAVLEPEPEPESEAEMVLDAAASMLREVESGSSGWEHERPWPETRVPASDAPDDLARTFAADGSVLSEQQAMAHELSREERNYRAKNAKRLAGVGGVSSVIRLHITCRSSSNELGVECAAQGKCYAHLQHETSVWRLELSGASSPGISTRRADGSRPPRMVVREMAKSQGWCWNKLGRCWYLDCCDQSIAVDCSRKLRIVCEREGLTFECHDQS